MSDLAELHDELRAVARDCWRGSRSVTGGEPGRPIGRSSSTPGGSASRCPRRSTAPGATFAEAAVVLEEMGRAASTSAYPRHRRARRRGALALVEPAPARDELLRAVAAGDGVAVRSRPTASASSRRPPPFRLERTGGELRLTAAPVRARRSRRRPAAPARRRSGDRGPVLVRRTARRARVVRLPVVDATRRFGTVAADGSPVARRGLAVRRRRPSCEQRPRPGAPWPSRATASAWPPPCSTPPSPTLGVRRQFGRPIGSFQAVKHACADMLVELAVGAASSSADAVERGRRRRPRRLAVAWPGRSRS